MVVGRLETRWSVTGGGAGMTVMHGIIDEADYDGGDATSSLTAIRTFFQSLAARVPNDVSWSWPGPVDLFSNDGVLVGSTTPSTAVPPLTATYAGTYAAPAGARIDWETGIILAGKRLRGRSYIVPLAGDQYDADGSLASDFISVGNTAATALRVALATAGSPLGVWSRKNSAIFAASGQTIQDKAAIMRSRRD